MSPSERTIIFLVGAVQFINILDFMMVMPLGPDFARALGIPASRVGYVGGAYTASAAVAGVACSFFLDRFDRRAALATAMTGLAVGTALGGFASSFEWLLAARVIAGAFGGPATSLAFSIVADVVPPERRGRATGAVMGAFSVASVLGVPVGLELARLGTWHLPFFVTAGLALVITAAAAKLLPPLRGHLAHSEARAPFASLLRAETLTSYLMTALLMSAGFVLIPNISPYLQGNLHYPRERLGGLYFAGGLVSFAATRVAGWMVDRFGSSPTAVFGVASLVATIYGGFFVAVPWVSVPMIFVSFMFAMSFRNVAYNTLASRVPRPQERSQFMSLQSAVAHLSAAGGAFLSSRLLETGADQILIGMPVVATTAITLSVLLPLVVWKVERGVLRRS